MGSSGLANPLQRDDACVGKSRSSFEFSILRLEGDRVGTCRSDDVCRGEFFAIRQSGVGCNHPEITLLTPGAIADAAISLDAPRTDGSGGGIPVDAGISLEGRFPVHPDRVMSEDGVSAWCPGKISRTRLFVGRFILPGTDQPFQWLEMFAGSRGERLIMTSASNQPLIACPDVNVRVEETDGGPLYGDRFYPQIFWKSRKLCNAALLYTAGAARKRFCCADYGRCMPIGIAARWSCTDVSSRSAKDLSAWCLRTFRFSGNFPPMLRTTTLILRLPSRGKNPIPCHPLRLNSHGVHRIFTHFLFKKNQKSPKSSALHGFSISNVAIYLQI